MSAAALSFGVGCSVDDSGLTQSLSGEGGANTRGNGGEGGGSSLGGNAAGGTTGAGGTAGKGAGGSGMGGTGVGGTAGTGMGGSGLGGSGLGGSGLGGSGVGGTGMGGSGMGGSGLGGSGLGGHIVDAGPDHVMVDMGPDVPVCDTAHGMHKCGDNCVSNSSTANCGASCTACPVPANSSATCDGTMCGFTCNSGFTLFNNACVRTCDTNCTTKATTVNLPGGRFTGTTSGTSVNTGSCGGGNAPEAVFQLVLTQTSDVFVTTHGSKFDTVIYMKNGCCGNEVICNNDADNRKTSMFNATSVPAGTYDIFVDGAGTAGGDFTVDIYASPSSSLPGDTCARPMRIADMPFIGNTTGYHNDYDPAGMGCGNTGGADVVFYFVLDAPTAVTFDTCHNTCIDTEIYLRDVCTSATVANQLACNDDACSADGNCLTSASQSSMMSDGQLTAGVHYVVVDTFVNPPGTPPVGLYTLTPTNVPP